MTAADTTGKIATGDLSASIAAVSVRTRAQRLLLRIAGHGEQILDAVTDPLDIPDYLLGHLVQAGTALVRLAELDAQLPDRVEVVLDGGGDLWMLVGEDEFECESGHERQALEQIRDRFGVVRVFTAAPPADQ